MFKGLALLAAGEVGGAMKRRLTAYSFYALAGLIAVAGCGYLLSALHIWLSVNYSPMHASLFIAAGLFAVAVIVAIIGAVQGKSPKTTTSSLQTAAAVVAAPVAMKAMTKASPTTFIALGVIAAGALLGRRLGK